MPLLCLSSPKGGVGKTMLAGSLAWELARLDMRVVALDLDPQNALRLHFGISLRDDAGLMPVLRRDGAALGRWQGALRRTESGVWLLPYGEADLAGAMADAAMMAAANSPLGAVLDDILSDPHAILIVDTPPGPSAALRAVLPWADLVVTVLLADATSIALLPVVEQGRAFGDWAGSGEPARHGFVLNQVSPLSRLGQAARTAAARHLGDRLLGTVTRDECVAEAIASRSPVMAYAPNSRAAEDLAHLADVLADRLAAVARQAMPSIAARAARLSRYADQAW